MKRIRKVIGKIHLWLGMASGAVVFIIAITGCLYAFKSEIQAALEPFRFVAPSAGDVLLPSRLKSIAEQQLPGKQVHAVLYEQPGRAAQVIFYNPEPDYYYYYVYLNPSSGEVLKVVDMDSDFFQFILDGHFYLWLPHDIGQKVTATATLIFLLMIVTGLFLWWPRSRRSAKQRFRVRWEGRWRRRNYDLHSVVGFYVTGIAIILACTGLVWGFQWFAEGWYRLAGGKSSIVYAEPLSDTTSVVKVSGAAIDRVYERMRREYPKHTAIEVHPPVNASSVIAANANPEQGTYWKRDFRYFDQHTMEELDVNHVYGRFHHADAADKLLRMNYDIHIGAILGLPGKVLVFLASLLCASLPVTGFIIWWGRRRKTLPERKTQALPSQRVRDASVSTFNNP